MKLLRAQQSGLCFGVRRAVQLAERLSEGGRRPILTLGPLIHNPQEVDRLARLGIEPRDRVEDCVGKPTLVRTHGITMQEQSVARNLSIDLVDATCPHVKQPRRHIQALGRAGRTVILLGDEGHPEVRALVSYRAGPVFIVHGVEDLPGLPASTPMGVVAQTTQAEADLSRLAAEVRRRFKDVVVVDTICRDTQLRQEEGQRLAGQVDLMLVIGGKNSANTARLAALCRAVQPRTYHLETAAELEGVSVSAEDTIGLISGASTPEWIVAAVEAALRSKSGN